MLRVNVLVLVNVTCSVSLIIIAAMSDSTETYSVLLYTPPRLYHYFSMCVIGRTIQYCGIKLYDVLEPASSTRRQYISRDGRREPSVRQPTTAAAAAAAARWPALLTS